MTTSTPSSPARRLPRGRARRRPLARLAALLPALAVALTAAPASAQVVGYDDARGDVHKSVGGRLLEQTVDRPDVDIVHTRVMHTRRVVTVQVTYVDIRRDGSPRFEELVVKPSGGPTYRAFLNTSDDAPDGELAVYRTSPRKVVQVDCGRQHIDWDADIVSITLPRRCLDRPRFVRIHHVVDVYRPRRDVTFEDQGSTTEAEDSGLGRRIYSR